MMSTDEMLIDPMDVGFDVSFLLSAQKNLHGTGLTLPVQLIADWFARDIARTPTNLRRHTQRVLYHFEQKDEQALAGALLDLLLVTGKHCSVLKNRLLRKVGAVLPNDVIYWFDKNLTNNAPDSFPNAISIYAVLADGTSGVTDLLHPVRASSTQRLDESITTVFERIDILVTENRWLEVLMNLEEEIKISPQEPTLHDLLRKVLRHLGDPSLIESFSERFPSINLIDLD